MAGASARALAAHSPIRVMAEVSCLTAAEISFAGLRRYRLPLAMAPVLLLHGIRRTAGLGGVPAAEQAQGLGCPGVRFHHVQAQRLMLGVARHVVIVPSRAELRLFRSEFTDLVGRSAIPRAVARLQVRPECSPTAPLDQVVDATRAGRATGVTGLHGPDPLARSRAEQEGTYLIDFGKAWIKPLRISAGTGTDHALPPRADDGDPVGPHALLEPHAQHGGDQPRRRPDAYATFGTGVPERFVINPHRLASARGPRSSRLAEPAVPVRRDSAFAGLLQRQPSLPVLTGAANTVPVRLRAPARFCRTPSPRPSRGGPAQPGPAATLRARLCAGPRAQHRRSGTTARPAGRCRARCQS